MTWQPGPSVHCSTLLSEYDARDPWTQRFISRDDEGELSVDVKAMNGLEAAAGALFVELIRSQAELGLVSADSSSSSWAPGRGSTASRDQQSTKADAPMAQYEPFRCTYVSDPTCVPQLRFANVTDAGADHHKREADRHWRCAGRTWSRVPRFRKDQSVFSHDPSYKPPHATVDRWYATDAGAKRSLAGRVQESRWQSCHSMQTGRAPRKHVRSRARVPPSRKEEAGPGPASYHMQDLWEVKHVCGTIPQSSAFCSPVHRVRPRTSALKAASSGHRMSVDTIATEVKDASKSESTKVRPASSDITNVKDKIFKRGPSHSAPASRKAYRRQALGRSRKAAEVRRGRAWRSAVAGGGAAVTSVARESRNVEGPPYGVRSRPFVGPLSFARAERPHVSDERRREEESYGKRVVRLLTESGDVLVTVNRRRTSAWGVPAQVGVLSARTRCNTGSKGGSPEVAIKGGAENKSPSHLHDGAAVSSCRTNRLPTNEERRHGSPRKVQSRCSVNEPHEQCRRSTLEAQAMRSLAWTLGTPLPAYREPGKAELPAIFQATSAPIVRFDAGESRRRSTLQRGLITDPTNEIGGVDADDGRLELGTRTEDEERVEKIVAAAEALVARATGGGEGGGSGGTAPGKAVATRIPAPLPKEDGVGRDAVGAGGVACPGDNGSGQTDVGSSTI